MVIPTLCHWYFLRDKNDYFTRWYDTWILTLRFGVRFLSTIRGLKQEYGEKTGVKLSISSFYERFTPKMVGVISFRGACSMRLSFKHSNPVVFWAIAINTSIGAPSSRAASCSTIPDTSSTSSSTESPAMAAISSAGWKKMLTNTRIYVEQKSSPSKQTDC